MREIERQGMRFSVPEDSRQTESTSKIEKLKQIHDEVEAITDRLGRPIDEGIKEAVVLLVANGLPTSDSCEGHSDWGLPVPYVEISAPDEPKDRFIGQKETFEKIAKEYNTTAEAVRTALINEAYWKAMRECSKNGETDEYRQWSKQNNVLLTKTRQLLDEFYRERQVEPDIKLDIDEGTGGLEFIMAALNINW